MVLQDWGSAFRETIGVTPERSPTEQPQVCSGASWLDCCGAAVERSPAELAVGSPLLSVSSDIVVAFG